MLQWIPVEHQHYYTILLATFKALHGQSAASTLIHNPAYNFQGPTWPCSSINTTTQSCLPLSRPYMARLQHQHYYTILLTTFKALHGHAPASILLHNPAYHFQCPTWPCSSINTTTQSCLQLSMPYMARFQHQYYYTILLTTFKALHGQAPYYLKELLIPIEEYTLFTTNS